MVTRVAKYVLMTGRKPLSELRRLQRVVLVALLGAAVTLLVACGASPELAGSEWQLEELEGAPPLEGTSITLDFEGSRFSGSAGCNTYTGDYSLAGDRNLTIPEVARTLLDCDAPAGIMEQEASYIVALTSAVTYRTVDDRLEIRDEAGAARLLFRQK
jgi:heat shock protein HslJ